jgi:hypothetical protein
MLSLMNTNTLDKTRIADIKAELNRDFSLLEDQLSTTLHIISIFLKSQKILYIESKNYCEFYLYVLMLPAIFISSMCSVISTSFRDISFIPIAISFLTAINAFILTIIAYLKLDAQAEAHKTSAYSFDQLQTLCEFTTGKILLSNGLDSQSLDGTITYDVKYVHNFIDEIELKVKEIKEKNQFVIPTSVRRRFPKCYYTNNFTKVKEIQIQDMILLNGLKLQSDIENFDNDEGNKYKDEVTITNIKSNYEIRRNQIDNYVDFKKELLTIDTELIKEIRHNADNSGLSYITNVFRKTDDGFVDMLGKTRK